MQVRSSKSWIIALAAIGLGLAAQPAKAGYNITFTNVTNNSTVDVADQMYLNIQDMGGSNVRFVFRNVGIIGSVINEIYFDDGSLMNPTTAAFNFTGSGSGVNFVAGSNDPTHPPGISGFNPSVVLDSDVNKNQADGIANAAANNGNEFLYFNFTLSDNQKFADIINSLTVASQNWNVDQPGGLRIALHVHGIQGAGDNDSDSFLSTGFGFDGIGNTGGDPINGAPAPAGLLLLATAFPVLALRRVLRRKPAVA